MKAEELIPLAPREPDVPSDVPTDGPLRDGFGRLIKNLRISVTDRCNFRCTYCMPEEGLDWLKREDILSYEEIDRLARIFASIGVEELRLTGGEPLASTRHDLNQGHGRTRQELVLRHMGHAHRT